MMSIQAYMRARGERTEKVSRPLGGQREAA
jgi:hypothetical protein